MSLRPVGEVGVAMRVQVGADQRTVFVDLQLGAQRVTMTQATAQALTAGIEQILGVAERFDAKEAARHGEFEQPALSYSSDLTLTLDVVHDVERDELVSMVAARLETILGAEGADCWGLGLRAEPNDRERSDQAPIPGE